MATVSRSSKLGVEERAAAIDALRTKELDVLVVGGGIVGIGPLFLASVRQSVYQRSLALSTRHLEVQVAPLGPLGGLIGTGVLAMHETMKVRGVLP